MAHAAAMGQAWLTNGGVCPCEDRNAERSVARFARRTRRFSNAKRQNNDASLDEEAALLVDGLRALRRLFESSQRFKALNERRHQKVCDS